MSTIVGGLRLSLIHESFYNLIHDGLDQIGWFKPNPGVRRDVTLLDHQLDNHEKIEPNMIGISFEDITDTEMEVGSNLTRDQQYVYLDIYAENEFLGRQLAGDIRDILRGKFVSHGRDGTDFPVYDTDGNVAFWCDIEGIDMSRVREFDKPFKRFWWVVGCVIIDDYYDDLS